MGMLKSKLPKWIFLQLLESCNLRCKMCYEWGNVGAYHEKEKLETLDIEIVKKVIFDCRKLHPHYELFGGEPLLYSHLEEVLKEMKKYGSTVDIPTNGTVLIDAAEMLVNVEADKLWISLDGPEAINDQQRGRGVYQKVITGIEKIYSIREHQGKLLPKIGIGTTVTPINYKYLEEFFLRCLDLNKIDCISLEMQAYTTQERLNDYSVMLKKEFNIENITHANGYLGERKYFEEIDLEELYIHINKIKKICEKKNILLNIYPKKITIDNLKKYFSGDWLAMDGAKRRCVFPWLTAEINARGEVASCHSMYDLVFGNVYDESLEIIWNNEKYNHFRKIMKKQLLPICPACCLYYNEKLLEK